MEQDVETDYRIVCCTCLSSGRNLQSINEQTQLYQMFRLLMYDFAGDRFGDSFSEMVQLVCWECLALMKRVLRFKQQVQSAQEHLRVLALSQEAVDHTYLSQSLSTLTSTVKSDYDGIYFDYSIGPIPVTEDWSQEYIVTRPADVKNESFDVAQAVSDNLVAQVVTDNINLDLDQHILEVPEIVLQNPVTGVMSQIVVNTDALVTSAQTSYPVGDTVKTEVVNAGNTASLEGVEKVILYPGVSSSEKKEVDPNSKCPYFTVMMSDEELQAYRAECKQKLQYASAYYKCELCIIGFYQQHQVEEHFVSAHKPSEGKSRCPVCYSYVPSGSLASHAETHYTKYICKLCGHCDTAERLIQLHCDAHSNAPQQTRKRRKKDADKEKPAAPPKPGDLRKLLSKTTIEGYKCLECDMFFKNSRARQTHVARYHREGLQCDHCKKRFVNRTTLVTHLKLHSGPPPRQECPVCHKMVRSVQLKYHVARHENTTKYRCTECDKVFSHLTTYQAHLKYARAHASDNVFKFPCPMCNKGYPTKEQMQDHFNYNHLNKTAHKCPICDKPIATRKNVERHMMRVHEGHKRERPRNHVCVHCGKAFSDKKSITQHLAIHSGDRPLACEICHQTFKQKASLYTHRKRVHKLFPQKKHVEFMPKPESVSAS